MAAVEALCLDITRRNGVPPRRVLAHSDVAPRRKIDPGEKFDREGSLGPGSGIGSNPQLKPARLVSNRATRATAS